MPNYSIKKDFFQLDLFLDIDPEDDENYVIEYIQGLVKNKVPIVYDALHLGNLIGYKLEFLYAISQSSNLFYRSFRIKKKSGGERVISEPLPSLKEIQNYILRTILKEVKTHKTARAFKKNNSVRGNASMHKNQKTVVCFDIKDFFGRISTYRVYEMFYNFGYTKEISRLLSGLCCLDDCLPQGSPTSPAISNIVMSVFDSEVFDFCKSNSLRYTRYADDITVSGEDPIGTGVVRYLRKKLKKMGMELNDNKFRVMRNGSRKIVTGVVINEKPNIVIESRRKIRQEVYYIKKYGIFGHLNFANFEENRYLERLIGRISNLYAITRNEEWKAEARYLTRILKEI